MRSSFFSSDTRLMTIPDQLKRADLKPCDVRLIESAGATELYITATPGEGSLQRQAYDMYGQIADVLREERAVVVQERLFANNDSLPIALAARAATYGGLDDGVMPTLLRTRDEDGPIVGAQVHAIRGIGKPKVIRGGDCTAARAFDCNGYHYLVGSSLRAPQLDEGSAQTRAAFDQTENLLTQAGGTLFDIARTWIWMDDILGWYSQLNQLRTRFFTERGLMSLPGQMPASTGIGVSPAGARIGLDFFAAWGREDAVAKFHAAGNQRSASEYGSAFARAARAKTPGGTTIFCSGTAAIDAKGNTCFAGDVQGQVRMTVQNVLAVLQDMGSTSDDVVQALAYCATPAAKECFIANFADDLSWPCLTLTGDVCRADLLFEIEVTACPTARR